MIPLEDVSEQLSFTSVDDGDDCQPEEQAVLSQLTEALVYIDDI